MTKDQSLKIKELKEKKKLHVRDLNFHKLGQKFEESIINLIYDTIEDVVRIYKG